ncbi:MAG TPA: hypothetical protein VFQ42_01775 [Mycobacterium sp.]|nr:hypothetical protein [Mycobacterium sp.]
MATAEEPYCAVRAARGIRRVGVYLAEIVSGTNITLFYTSGEEVVKAQ